MTKYELYDEFNDRVISRHRTPTAAGRAARKIDNALSGGSYLPMCLLRDGERVEDYGDSDGDEFYRARAGDEQA